jgi:two-component system nitrogen regulation response regulator NtrX
MARILIVDDEQSIRRVLRDILELEKYQVDEAVDGLDCLVKLKQNEYDAIILDIKMQKWTVWKPWIKSNNWQQTRRL